MMLESVTLPPLTVSGKASPPNTRPNRFCTPSCSSRRFVRGVQVGFRDQVSEDRVPGYCVSAQLQPEEREQTTKHLVHRRKRTTLLAKRRLTPLFSEGRIGYGGEGTRSDRLPKTKVRPLSCTPCVKQSPPDHEQPVSSP